MPLCYYSTALRYFYCTRLRCLAVGCSIRFDSAEITAFLSVPILTARGFSLHKLIPRYIIIAVVVSGYYQ